LDGSNQAERGGAGDSAASAGDVQRLSEMKKALDIARRTIALDGIDEELAADTIPRPLGSSRPQPIQRNDADSADAERADSTPVVTSDTLASDIKALQELMSATIADFD